jgi:hypothetical protein
MTPMEELTEKAREEMNEEITRAWKKFEDAREAFHIGQTELRRQMEAAFEEYQEVKKRI